MDKDQIFLHQAIYPKASDIFNVDIKPIEEIIDNCIFVIDTNVLLLPYTTTSSGFEEIKKAFSKLISKNQLLIPAQVAREFAKNRPEKIKTLFQQLNVIKSKIHKPSIGQYPLLES
ncbi:MAG: PIN-like domain-containing protein, partial [Flavobacterium sp.]